MNKRGLLKLYLIIACLKIKKHLKILILGTGVQKSFSVIESYSTIYSTIDFKAKNSLDEQLSI